MEPTRRRIVICGLKNTGKTTYVREHAAPWDLVFDYDRVAAAIVAGNVTVRHAHVPAHVLEATLRVRDALANWLVHPACQTDTAWLIISRCSTAAWFAQRLHAERVHLGSEPCGGRP